MSTPKSDLASDTDTARDPYAKVGSFTSERSLMTLGSGKAIVSFSVSYAMPQFIFCVSNSPSSSNFFMLRAWAPKIWRMDCWAHHDAVWQRTPMSGSIMTWSSMSVLHVNGTSSCHRASAGRAAWYRSLFAQAKAMYSPGDPWYPNVRQRLMMSTFVCMPMTLPGSSVAKSPASSGFSHMSL